MMLATAKKRVEMLTFRCQYALSSKEKRLILLNVAKLHHPPVSSENDYWLMLSSVAFLRGKGIIVERDLQGKNFQHLDKTLNLKGLYQEYIVYIKHNVCLFCCLRLYFESNKEIVLAKIIETPVLESNLLLVTLDACDNW